MTAQRTEPFCDWLDVTCSPDDSFLERVRLFFDSLMCPVAYADEQRTVIEVGAGKLVLDEKPRFHRSSASGEVLSFLRVSGVFEQYLSLLSEVPHTVTRLDAAVDAATDGPDVLRRLERRFPDDRVCLTRKALRVTRLYSARPSDGRQTGTWYVGHRSSGKVTARVYDKQAQMMETKGIDTPPKTRYEMTFRKEMGCTLRDAAMPASLFYQYASPTLIDRPPGVPDWESGHDCEWSSVPSDLLPYEVFLRRLETSPELARLAELAGQFGEVGGAAVLRAFETQLRRNMPKSDALKAG